MSDELQPGTMLHGRYRVVRALGSGGMGAVYLAEDLRTRREVALKVAHLGDPAARDLFQHEAATLRRLQNHALPRVWDVLSDTQRDVLVMEYIAGPNLDERVRAEGPQPELLVLSWADELLLALDYLHSQNPPIIHRDVKPANLKLRADGSLALVDFGIAKELVPGQFTRPAAAAVSPGYSPPEQYPGSTTTDARSDLYAAGATLYFLLTAAIPPSATERASGARSLAPAGALTRGLTPATQMLVGRALKLKRDERWPSAAAMREAAAQAAEALAGAEPLPVKPPSPPTRTPRPAKARPNSPQPARVRRRVVMGGALVGVALLAAAGVVWLPGIANIAGRTTATATATRTPAPAAVEPATAVATVNVLAATDVPKLTPADTVAPVLLPTGTKRPATATLIAANGTTPVPQATPSTSIQASPARSPLPVPTPALQVTLVEPAPGSTLNGLAAFTWRANRTQADNEALELIFWRPGQNPLNDGLGIIGYKTQQAGTVWIDLPSIEKQLGDLFRPGDYLWGVRSIQIAPYQRLHMVSEPRTVRYGAGSADANGSSRPAVPPTAEPPSPVPPTAEPPTPSF